MNNALIQNQQAIFSPPLEMPLRLRGRAGHFGMNRTRTETTYTTSSGLVERYTPHQMHTGLDLQADENDPVFAARGGVLVHINEISGDINDRRMFIRHSDPGAPSFMTRYLHVKDPKISVGDSVAQGQCIAEIGRPRDPHLHFEIRLIINPSSSDDWHNRNTEPLDPIPFLYRWERIYFEQISGTRPGFGDRALLDFAGVVTKNGVYFFEVKHNDDWFYVPLHYAGEHDLQIVRTLTDAFTNRSVVRLAAWESPFFGGRKVIRSVRLGGTV